MSKTLDIEKIELQPATYNAVTQKYEKDFVARQNILAHEARLFLEDFDKFKDLMAIPPQKWVTRKVYRRNLRLKVPDEFANDPDSWTGNLEYQPCFSGKTGKAEAKSISWLIKERKKGVDTWNALKNKCEITPELEARVARIAALAETDKPKFKKDSKAEVKLFALDNGKKIPLVEEVSLPTKDKQKWISAKGDVEPYVVTKTTRGGKTVTVEYMPNVNGSFSCTENTPLQFRIMGPLDETKKVIDSMIKMKLIDPTKIGLTKNVVDKSERDKGAFCSDTIRAYFNPSGEEEEEEEFAKK